jgi:hypothetical protein
MALKVGDRVIYTGSHTSWAEGEIGTITALIDDGETKPLARIQWDNFEKKILPFAVFTENITLVDDLGEPVKKITEIAQQLVYGDRGAAYGHPKHDYDRTAKMISGILSSKLKEDVDAKEAILIMIAVKMSRLVNTPGHRDSVIDIAGYAECYDRVVRYEAGEVTS